MSFVRIQFDEPTQSFRLLEDDSEGMFSDGDIYLVAVSRPDPEPDSQWIHQAVPEPAHA